MKNISKLTAVATLAGFMTAPAFAQTMSDSEPFVRPPAVPARACADFIATGAGRTPCDESIRFWADSYAAEVEKFAADPAGFQAYGNVDNPELVPPGTGDMPNMNGQIFAAHVRGACQDLRTLDDQAGLDKVVIAADNCLRMTFTIAKLGGVEADHIDRLGNVLRDVSVSLSQRKDFQFIR